VLLMRAGGKVRPRIARVLEDSRRALWATLPDADTPMSDFPSGRVTRTCSGEWRLRRATG